ncbi:hypothetical protein BDZ91DRAFT_345071 [Kalaharituber pfeilii]|nr:hypothetical protein BDZ91DRAFT_345071 [Kalaharituber pfeilii]
MPAMSDELSWWLCSHCLLLILNLHILFVFSVLFPGSLYSSPDAVIVRLGLFPTHVILFFLLGLLYYRIFFGSHGFSGKKDETLLLSLPLPRFLLYVVRDKPHCEFMYFFYCKTLD